MIATRLSASVRLPWEVVHPGGSQVGSRQWQRNLRKRCRVLWRASVTAYDQGAHVTYLDPSGSQLGHKESIADTAAASIRDGRICRAPLQTIAASPDQHVACIVARRAESKLSDAIQADAANTRIHN